MNFPFYQFFGAFSTLHHFQWPNWLICSVHHQKLDGNASGQKHKKGLPLVTECHPLLAGKQPENSERFHGNKSVQWDDWVEMN